MRIKQFEAKSMREALAMIKKEFGPEAVIVSAKNVKKGGVFGLSNSSGVVVVAALDGPSEDAMAPAPELLQGRKGSTGLPESRVPAQVHGVAGSLQSRTPHVSPIMFGGRTRGRVSPMRPRNRKDLYVLYHQLLFQGVQEAIAIRLVSELQNLGSLSLSSGREEVARYLGEAARGMGLSHRRLSIRRDEQQIVVFAGPTGVGKTSTLAKFAGFAQSSKLRGRIGWLSLDCYKVGYLAQAKVYSAIMGVPVELVSSARQFRDALRRMADKDLIIVDTPGIGPRDEERISTVSAILAGHKPMEVYLLVSAATRHPELHEIIERFSALPVTGLLVTKTDESRSFGALLNTLLETGLPLSYFTTGQGVPDDIEIATPEKLMGLILSEDAAGKIWSGPPEVLAEKVSLFEDLLAGAGREDRVEEASEQMDSKGNGRTALMAYNRAKTAYR